MAGLQRMVSRLHFLCISVTSLPRTGGVKYAGDFNSRFPSEWLGSTLVIVSFQ